MKSSSCVGAPLVLPVVVSSGYSCHVGLDAMESYLILRAVVLAHIYGICFTTPAWWWLCLLGGHLDFPCCDPVRGAFLGWSGLPLWHFGPQCPILLHLEQWESHAGKFVLPAGCCYVQLGQSLEGASGV